MIEIHMGQVKAGVGEMEGGVKVLKVQDPDSGIAVVIPFDLVAAARIGNALAGRAIMVPSNGAQANPETDPPPLRHGDMGGPLL